MMTGKSSARHRANFARVCAKVVEDGDADLLFACGVGAFRQGLREARIDVGAILTEPFGESVRFAEVNNYLAVWGFGGASQPGASQPGPCSGGASQPSVVSQRGVADIYRVNVGRDVDAVILRFNVHTSGYGKVHVVTANMHIVCGKTLP